MSVFISVKDAAVAAERALAEAARVANRAYALLAALEAVLVEGPKVLTTLKNAVQAAITFVSNAIGVIRNNPAASGAWRILFLILAGVLRGVEIFLRGVKEAIEFMIGLLTSQPARALRKAIQAIEERVLQYLALSIRARNLVGYLMGLAEFLERQEDDFEKADPGLKPTVENTYIREITDALTVIGDALHEVNAQVDEVTAKIDVLVRLRNDVNGVVSLVAGALDAVNAVLGLFRNLFDRIKDLISSIPFIGWLQDKLTEAIDWAMDRLGIRALLQRAGEAIRDLPFVKAVFDFMDAVKAAINDIVAAAEGVAARVVSQIAGGEALGGFIGTLIAFLSKLNLKKFAEFLCPEWIRQLIEKYRAIRERLDADPTPEGREKAARDLRAVFAQTRGFVMAGTAVGGLPFHAEREPAFNRTLGEVAALAGRPGDDPVAMLEVLAPLTQRLEALSAGYAEMYSEQQKLGAAYFLRGYELLDAGQRSQEALAGHREVVELLRPIVASLRPAA